MMNDSTVDIDIEATVEATVDIDSDSECSSVRSQIDVSVYSPAKKRSAPSKQQNPWTPIMLNPSETDLKEVTRGFSQKTGGYSKPKYFF